MFLARLSSSEDTRPPRTRWNITRVGRETAPKPCLLILVMEVRMELLTVFGGIALLLIVAVSAFRSTNGDRASRRRGGNDTGVDGGGD